MKMGVMMNNVGTVKGRATSLKYLCYLWCGLIGVVLLLQPTPLFAGIYDADGPVTYKEYWVDHDQFTGGNDELQLPTCVDTEPDGGEFYLEPWGNCEKSVTLTIPDNFSNALRAELFLDLWRAHDEHAVRYRLNGGPLRAPAAGTDWGRSPYVTQLNLNELNQGTNTLVFVTDGSPRKYHVHDIAVRIYYDAGHPLSGSDVTAPDGKLLTIQDDNGTVSPDAGGTLNVNNDQLTFTALITETNLSHVEFHAYYEGYDLDNDGSAREWKNRNRQSCNPGGTTVAGGCRDAYPPIGATIDHIGSTGPGGTFSNCSWNNSTKIASCTWNLKHVTNQGGVRFKIRVIDTNGNVAEAPDGVSAPFKLVRNGPTAAYLIPNFTDVVLHHGGLPDYPDTYTTTLTLPSTVSNFDTFYLLGSYFQNPKVYFNTKLVRPFTPGSTNPVDDEWTLSVQPIPSNRVFAGPNTVQYDYSSGWGQFIEEPGPMVVFRRANTAGFSDTAAPVASGFEPTNGATNVDRFQPVVAYVSDGLGVGVDITTLKLKIDGNAVPAQITGFSDSYKLTYSKPGGFTHSTDYTVTVEAKDLLNNTMTPTSFSFRIEDPDFTPPVITNTQVITSFTQAVISWETDEPATSKVSFGTTASYTGTVEDTNYVTSHKLIIPDLHSNARYHFAITSVDSDNNSATTADATFTTPLRIAMVSDDFNACALDPMWEFVNPRNDASYHLDGQHLIISVPGGVGHDIWSNGTPIIRAPHVVQNVTDPNQLLVKFASGVTQAIQQQGILAIQDPDNFMRINFQYVAGEVQIVMVRVRDGNARVVKSATVTGASPSGPLYLFLTRDEDNRWRPRYSLDGSTWNNFGTVNEIYAINKVGIYAGNASDGGPVPPFEAVVDYFSNEETPINPVTEDAIAQTLPVSANPVDKGTVTKNVECGNPVTLTATAVPGWSFANWSGATTGTENPKEIPFDYGDFVVANFAQDHYTLAANKVGDGTFSYTPQQATYLYNDSVTLNATADPGWRFDGWNGDATGTTNPLVLQLTGNTAVTATFSQEHYTLTTDVVGSGSVVPSPQQGSYVYGDVVTLVAEPTVGWSFVGWSDQGLGTDSTVQVTITGNTTISAIFAKNEYTIARTVIGSGDLTLAPEKTVYEHGDLVQFKATANAAGWVFARWEGDLTGTINPQSVTMERSLAVTAVFTKTRHILTELTIGNGSLVVTPRKEFYFYGDNVTVTALPATGWTLDGWSGDSTGRDNPITLVMDGNKSVIARFVEAPYQLTTTVAGQGTIKRSPDLQFFKDGDNVLLTAEAAPGWRFDGWTGALSGTENPVTVTMNSDKTVSANFVQIGYTVAVDVASTVANTDATANTVAIAPAKSSYSYGDLITLTATEADGWTFAGWNGDVNGIATTTQLTVTQDLAITARFTPTLYPLDYELVSGTGSESGQIIADPEGPYTHGQVVTLTAKAADGYIFVEWIISDLQAADAGVSNPVLTITIPDGRTFRARFVEATGQGQIFLPFITR